MTAITTAATTASSASTTTTSTGTASQLSADAFLTLLAAELQNQDPTEPMDGQQMVDQLAQLTSVSELSQLNANFEEAQGTQLVAQVAGLIGHDVAWIDSSSGETVTGTVDSVELSSGAWVVNVGEQQVGLDSVLAIS
jgi:flagellar basal-body rod modification protein FlgD